jgi:hypothetical protein
MAKIHSFSSDTSGNCRVVIHAAIPSGNNAVGQSWKACWIAAGRNVTVLPEGTGLGQITPAEKASVLAGDLIEFASEIPLITVLQGIGPTHTFANSLIAATLATLQTELNYFGWTYG